MNNVNDQQMIKDIKEVIELTEKTLKEDTEYVRGILDGYKIIKNIIKK